MSKQTAVQWLKEKLPSLFVDDNNGFYSKLFEEALQMEREQIQDAFYYGIAIDAYNVKDTWTETEKYYNQTYGGQDE
jgi:hypothetical protein